MRRYGYLICACVGVLAFPLSLARADITLQQRYLNIYLKINEAEHLEKQGDFQGALDDFKDCYDGLEKIHNIDPDWETALVDKRMEDCRSKIDELKIKVEENPVPPPTPPPPYVPQTPDVNATNTTPVPIVPLVDTNDVPTLKAQLASVKAQLDDMTARYHDMAAKYDNARIEAQTLHAQLDAVNQQLIALKQEQSVDDRVGKLLTENTALTDKLAAAEKELDTIKANPKTTLTKVQAQLKNTNDRLEAAQVQNTALQQTATMLKQQLDQAQNDLSVANQKLASASTTSPEYDTLKRENEIMRDILTRELQEQAHRDMAKRLYQEEFDRLKITSKVLQEQVDILSSPMTPPTNDQERALLESLKISAAGITPPPTMGNSFAASNTNPTDTNAPPVTPASPPAVDPTATPPSTPAPDTNVASNPAVPPTTPDNSTNPATPPASPPTTNLADNNVPPPPPPPSDAPTSPAPDTNAAPMNQAPVPPPSSPSTDTSNAAPASVTPPPTMPDASTTNAAPVTTTTDTPPASPAPAPTDTNITSAPATPPSTPDTNAPTVTQIPPGTTTYTDTTIKQSGGDTQPDPTEYANRPKLPDDMRDTAQAAADLFKMQKYDEAASKYQTIIDKYPESLYAWSNLGVVRFQQGNYDDALKALQQAVKLSPSDAFSYSNLGIVYYQMGQYENAISALERALALDPNDAKSHNYLGCACSQKGWSEVAEREFLKAIAIDDNFGDAHFNLALVYATEKPPSLELARRHYNRALELGISKDTRLEKLLQ